MGISRPLPSETPARIDALAKLPVFWALEDRRCIVSGGSDAAAWKAELLAACGAHVEVYSEALGDMMRALAARSATRISLVSRRWQETDLRGATMAIADCEDENAAAVFSSACKHAGVPVNIIDKPRYCQFQFGSIVNRSPVIVAISTDGAAPVLAQTIRRKIEVLLPATLKDWAEFAQSLRSRISSLLPTAMARRRFWEIFADRAFSHRLTARTETELLAAVFEQAPYTGDVQVFCVDPGDPELLTLKIIRSLQTADVIHFDQDITPEILQFGRREAMRVESGMRFKQTSLSRPCRVVRLISCRRALEKPDCHQ